MRERGWVVPAYTLAPGAEHIRVLRALCREDFSIQSAEMCASPHCIVHRNRTAKPCTCDDGAQGACTVLALAKWLAAFGCQVSTGTHSASPPYFDPTAMQLRERPTDRFGVAGEVVLMTISVRCMTSIFVYSKDAPAPADSAASAH